MFQMDGFFSSENPFLARLWHFWQQGAVLLSRYSFTGHWDPLTANAVGESDTFSIDPSIDFVLLEINFVAYGTTGDQNTAVLSPNVLLSLSEKSGANLFSDEAHHVGLWTGASQNGRRIQSLCFPRLLRGNNEILASLTNNAGTPMEVWLGFEGIRVTYVNTQRQEVFPGMAF